MSETKIPERWRSEYDELCLLSNFKFPERRKKLIEELGAAETKNAGYYRMLYDDLGCRESCMGWVNDRAEMAEATIAEQAGDLNFRDVRIIDLEDIVKEQAATIERLKQRRGGRKP